MFLLVGSFSHEYVSDRDTTQDRETMVHLPQFSKSRRVVEFLYFDLVWVGF